MSVKIHGKEYLTVAERLDTMNKKAKGNYSINTELLKFEGGCVIIKATLSIGSYSYTGIAMEEAGSNKINETSFVEVCETSAIGRALASAGYHGSEFCSADELVNALANQKTPKTKTVESKENDLIEEVIEKYDGVEVKNVVSFGKHNGKEWKDVPQDYVEWCAGGSKIEWQRDAANEELQRRSNNGDKPKDVTNTEVSKDELEDVPF